MTEHLPFIAEREKEKREREREREEIEETIHLVCITPTIIGKKDYVMTTLRSYANHVIIICLQTPEGGSPCGCC